MSGAARMLVQSAKGAVGRWYLECAAAACKAGDRNVFLPFCAGLPCGTLGTCCAAWSFSAFVSYWVWCAQWQSDWQAAANRRALPPPGGHSRARLPAYLHHPRTSKISSASIGSRSPSSRAGRSAWQCDWGHTGLGNRRHRALGPSEPPMQAANALLTRLAVALRSYSLGAGLSMLLMRSCARHWRPWNTFTMQVSSFHRQIALALGLGRVSQQGVAALAPDQAENFAALPAGGSDCPGTCYTGARYTLVSNKNCARMCDSARAPKPVGAHAAPSGAE